MFGLKTATHWLQIDSFWLLATGKKWSLQTWEVIIFYFTWFLTKEKKIWIGLVLVRPQDKGKFWWLAVWLSIDHDVFICLRRHCTNSSVCHSRLADSFCDTATSACGGASDNSLHRRPGSLRNDDKLTFLSRYCNVIKWTRIWSIKQMIVSDSRILKKQQVISLLHGCNQNPFPISSQHRAQPGCSQFKTKNQTQNSAQSISFMLVQYSISIIIKYNIIIMMNIRYISTHLCVKLKWECFVVTETQKQALPARVHDSAEQCRW